LKDVDPRVFTRTDRRKRYYIPSQLRWQGDNKTLHFLRRNLIARPSLEYVSSCWDPYIKEHIEELEKVQRRGTRFVNNYKTRDPRGAINTLQGEPLAHRRAKASHHVI
jgi:hypothetical protein